MRGAVKSNISVLEDEAGASVSRCRMCDGGWVRAIVSGAGILDRLSNLGNDLRSELRERSFARSSAELDN